MERINQVPWGIIDKIPNFKKQVDYVKQTFPQTPTSTTVTTTDIKTNMRHIHTSIVSRNLASHKRQ